MAVGTRLRLVRPADHLIVEVELGNLEVDAAGDTLTPVDPTRPGVLVFHFASQHLAEEAFLVFETEQVRPTPPPVRTVAAGPTRLAFELPPGQSLPLTVGALLNWDALTPRLAANALPRGTVDGPAAAIPPDDVTAIEFPWRLLLSPDPASRWEHGTDPVEHGGRVEVWRTRLRNRNEVTPEPPAVRAIGARSVPDQFATSLVQRDVDDLVRLSGDFSIAPRNVQRLPPSLWLFRLVMARLRGWHWVPTPMDADRLQLSAFGADVRLRGRWSFPGPEVTVDLQTLGGTFGVATPSLEAYDHVAGGGRDQYVRVVRRGFLSCGHRASIVKITERRFEVETVGLRTGPDGQTYQVFGSTAYLRQWYEIVLQQPELDYSGLADGYDAGGREMPFRRLRIGTLRTPPIDLPRSMKAIEQQARELAGDDETAFQQQVQRLIDQSLQVPRWIQVGGRDFEFSLSGTDWTGATVDFTAPLMFVPLEVVVAGNTAAVQSEFASGPAARRTRALNKQAVTLADPSGCPDGATRSETVDVTFTLQAVDQTEAGRLPLTYQPRWLLAVASATVALPAAEHLAGGDGTRAVAFHADYLGGGLQPVTNPGGRFLRLLTPLTLAFGGEQGGGVARPNSTLDAVSAHVGLVADAFRPGPVSAGSLVALFGNAKLFGSVRLSDLLAPLQLAADEFVQAGEDLEAKIAAAGQTLPVPVLRTRRVPGGTELRYVWKPKLARTPLFAFGPDTELLLDARKLTADDGTSRGSDVVGRLRHFAMQFFDVAEVRLDLLQFRAEEGRKTDLTAEGFDLRFLGPLTFINTLRDLLPADGFSDPPAVTIGPDGIRAGYTLGVPTVGVGVFSLQNLAVGAELAVPFDDHPAAVRFAVSERHAPFLVTVTLFGGGGFFALVVSAKGVEQIEASIEFGGNVSLNLGVASGGVHVMAGIYFGRTGDVCTLTGYLRCGGYLSVLGLISISVEFYLAFTYRDKGGGHSEIWGQATVSVTVEITFFSTTVSLSVEKRFGGAAGDPSFADALDVDDWQDYCLAFA